MEKTGVAEISEDKRGVEVSSIHKHGGGGWTVVSTHQEFVQRARCDLCLGVTGTENL